MANSLSQLRAPTIPDYYLCDAAYGEEILTTDCSLALSNFHSQYPLGVYHSSDFPLEASAGTCYLTVELAGPGAPQVIPIVGAYGYTVNDAVAWITGHCILASNGIGGFVTIGISRLQNYITSFAQDYWNNPFPTSIYFFTVTISGPPGKKKPGDFDPSVAMSLSNRFKAWLRERGGENKDTEWYIQRQRLADVWEIQSIRMTRGGSSIPWYTLARSVTDEMAYECDANLGSPEEVDCAQIEWNQLHPTTDTVTVTPTAAKFFHYNTCSLAISALTTITLTWDQIRTALAALMNVCVQNPTQSPQGGRAYASPARQINNKRRRDNAPNGLNALPPSVNLTIFQQIEPWSTTPTNELKTCTWRAVMDGAPVTNCK